jgi:hypothetical protein
MGLLLLSAPPIIPPSLRPSCYAWYDARKTNLADATKWTDYSGHGRDMTLYNFAGTPADGWVSGRPSHLQTDGVDSYGLYNPGATINAANTSCSLIVAVRPAGQTEDYYVMGSNGTDGAILLYTYGGTLNPYIYDSLSGDAFVSLLQWTAGTWYIIALSYDQTTKKMSVYINGVYAGISGALTNGLMLINRAYIANNAGTEYCPESLGFLGLFPGKVLSEADQKQIYNNNCKYFGLSKVA